MAIVADEARKVDPPDHANIVPPGNIAYPIYLPDPHVTSYADSEIITSITWPTVDPLKVTFVYGTGA